MIGKPRNGKSLRVMLELLLVELTTTERNIVGNMVWYYDDIQDWLIQNGHGNINARRRFRMLKDIKQMRHFWLYRGSDVEPIDIPKPEDYDAKSGGEVNYDLVLTDRRFWTKNTKDEGDISLRGTCYVIDECNALWPARGWQQTSRHAEYYTTQHGKLNDRCFFITQNTKLVDPNFYRLCEDYTYCINYRMKKYGRFRGSDKFVASTYQAVPANTNEPTLNVFEYKLDLAVARCYDTSAGVGIAGGTTADGGARAKGWSLKWVWVMLGIILLLCFCVIKWVIPRYTRDTFTRALGGSEKQEKVVSPPAGPVSTVPGKAPPVAIQGKTPEEPVWMVGYAGTPGNSLRVWLSDGTTVGGASVRNLYDFGVELVDGRWYRMKPKTNAVAPVPVAGL